MADAHAGLVKTMPPGSTAIASVEVLQAELALAKADPREAVRVLQQALPAYGDRPETNVNGIQALLLLTRAHLMLGDVAAAARHADDAMTGARQAMTGFAHSRWLGNALVAQGLVRRARGEADAAKEAWRAALVELTETEGETAPSTEEVRRLLAGA